MTLWAAFIMFINESLTTANLLELCIQINDYQITQKEPIPLFH